MSVESASNSPPAPASPPPVWLRPETYADIAKQGVIPAICALVGIFVAIQLLTRDNRETRDTIKEWSKVKEERTADIAVLKERYAQLSASQATYRDDQGQIKKEVLDAIKGMNERMDRFDTDIKSILRAVGVVEGQNSRTGGPR